MTVDDLIDALVEFRARHPGGGIAPVGVPHVRVNAGPDVWDSREWSWLTGDVVAVSGASRSVALVVERFEHAGRYDVDVDAEADRAYRSGYDDGLAEGRAEGRQAGRAEVERETHAARVASAAPRPGLRAFDFA